MSGSAAGARPAILSSLCSVDTTAAARATGRRDGNGAATARPWAFATDGGWTCGVYGIPSFGFAPGEERHAHTNTERLDVEEARWAFGRYPRIVQAVQETLA